MGKVLSWLNFACYDFTAKLIWNIMSLGCDKWLKCRSSRKLSTQYKSQPKTLLFSLVGDNLIVWCSKCRCDVINVHAQTWTNISHVTVHHMNPCVNSNTNEVSHLSLMLLAPGTSCPNPILSSPAVAIVNTMNWAKVFRLLQLWLQWFFSRP